MNHHEIADWISEAFSTLIVTGAPLPYRWSLIASNGAMMLGTVAHDAERDRMLGTIVGTHGPDDFTLPANVMVVDGAGEASHVVLAGECFSQHELSALN